MGSRALGQFVALAVGAAVMGGCGATGADEESPSSGDVDRLAHVMEQCAEDGDDHLEYVDGTLLVHDVVGYIPTPLSCVRSTLGLSEGIGPVNDDPQTDFLNSGVGGSGRWTERGIQFDWANEPFTAAVALGDDPSASEFVIRDTEGLTWSEHLDQYE